MCPFTVLTVALSVIVLLSVINLRGTSILFFAFLGILFSFAITLSRSVCLYVCMLQNSRRSVSCCSYC